MIDGKNCQRAGRGQLHHLEQSQVHIRRVLCRHNCSGTVLLSWSTLRHDAVSLKLLVAFGLGLSQASFWTFLTAGVRQTASVSHLYVPPCIPMPLLLQLPFFHFARRLDFAPSRALPFAEPESTGLYYALYDLDWANSCDYANSLPEPCEGPVRTRECAFAHIGLRLPN